MTPELPGAFASGRRIQYIGKPSVLLVCTPRSNVTVPNGQTTNNRMCEAAKPEITLNSTKAATAPEL